MRKSLFGSQLGTVFTLLLPIIYIVIAVLLLFSGIDTAIFAKLLGGLAIILGAAMIIQYFLTHAYLDTAAYGFSIGALAIVLGVCILIKSGDVAKSLSFLLNICIMLTAIVKLQNAIQLKFQRSVWWIPVLCVSLAFLVCTVLITVDPFTGDDGDTSVRDLFTYIVLLCDGVVSFANALLLRIVMRRTAGLPQPKDGRG